MKITEHVAMNDFNGLSQSKKTTVDFEQWLHSSTKQTDGGRDSDEYYVLHQNQLEQSDLNFASSDNFLIQKKERLQFLSNKSLEQVNVSTKVKNIPLNINGQNEQFKCITNQASNQPLLDSILTQLNSVLIKKEPFKSIPVAISLNIDKATPLEFVSDSESNVKANSAFRNLNQAEVLQPLFNKHQLFIEQNQIELTLNLQYFKSEEQKELVQWLKKQLKNKGLTLSQLIINGEKNG